MTTVHLAAERISVRPAGASRDVLRDVSVEVRRGEILVIAGPNGSGKSTLLRALGGGQAPRAGRIVLDGRDLRTMTVRERTHHFALLPQDPRCAEGLSVEELVALGRSARHGMRRVHDRTRRAAVDAALRALGLDRLRTRRIETLSGGERRRAWIATVLAHGAPTILLDEPTAALDLRHQIEILELVGRLHREAGRTFVVVLHDLGQAARLAHRMVLLHSGRVYATGSPQECLHQESLQDVFAVRARLHEESGLHVRVEGPADPTRNL